MNKVLVLSVLFVLSVPCLAADMFPFPIRVFDIQHDATDMSWMNEDLAGEYGFVKVKDGHFLDGKGKRIRFLGVNLGYGGCFPEHSDAERLAARLAKLGVNCVRLHSMDGMYSPKGIWDPAFKDHQHIDAGQLDKLDYLIFQFKRRGIYSNINLHVTRKLTEADGFPDASKLLKYDKGVDNFETRMIVLQKEYARQLLTHLNPYTSTRYVDEPSVAMIEINNENSLVNDCVDGSIGDLPEYYLAQLRDKWVSWLRAKYASTDKLRESWQAGSEPIGDNILSNSDYANGTERWLLEAPAPAEAVMGVENNGPQPGMKCLHAIMTKPGKESWHFQVHQLGLDLVEGKPYTVRFWARSDQPRPINLDVRLDKAPWRSVGLSRIVKFTPEWQEYEYSFYASQVEPNHTRLSFNLQNAIGEVWLAGIELRRGGGGGLPDDANLEKGSIPFPIAVYTTSQRDDFLAFAIDTEHAYAQGMYDFIKKTLNAKSMVIDSQVCMGGIAGLYRESFMDYGDNHRYWQHPYFPHKPWDGNDWTIGNTPMVKMPGDDSLTWLALHRIAGKPFVVSEYNHPAPSDYSAECIPMLASYAAQQDWDGIFLFDYHSNGEWIRDYIASYFPIDSHPAKIAFFPTAAAIFRRVGVPPLKASVEMEFPISGISSELLRNGTNIVPTWESLGFAKAETISARTSVRFSAKGKAIHRKDSKTPPSVSWNRNAYTINSPSSRGIVGFFGGNPVTLGGLTIHVLEKPDKFAAITVISLDGEPIESSGHLLISAVGRAENQGMVWNENRTSVGRNWGKGPVMAEGISARISLPASLMGGMMYTLDGGGARTTLVPCRQEGDEVVLDLGPQYKTLWYEVSLDR
ncbi:MAG TPA: carbohydrate binding domain-containing protein [Armatimonadota bacterium]|nr:carbohydrate binding domain-containing protein [Armatimonadota bacterium]